MESAAALFPVVLDPAFGGASCRGQQESTRQQRTGAEQAKPHWLYDDSAFQVLERHLHRERSVFPLDGQGIKSRRHKEKVDLAHQIGGIDTLDDIGLVLIRFAHRALPCSMIDLEDATRRELPAVDAGQ